jgi:hypothetical protein
MPEDLIVSIHEAGHALTARELGRPIDSVTLTENGGEFREYEVAAWEPTTAEGKERFRDAVLASIGPGHRGEMMPIVIGLVAGLSAQRRIVGHAFDEYGDSDMEQARSIARAVTSSPAESYELLTYAMEQADQIIARHWPTVAALASELLRHRRLSAEQINAIIERSAPQRLAYGYERRGGQDVPTQNPDPRRMTSVTMRRTDGYIA